jgi:MoaA/NifB/PqqE/SkfB family radical SAM enzyme
MTKTQITPLKLVRYQDRLTGPIRPIHWDVDPSTVCDHRCRNCPYIYEGEGPDPMLGVVRPGTFVQNRELLNLQAFERFMAYAKEHGCEAVTFVGGGEPTMHPAFVEMMECCIELGLKFGLISHFGRKTYDHRFYTALSKATWVRASVNAAKRETYLAHQGRDDFDRVLANINVAAHHDIRIGYSFLVTGENWQEAIAAAFVARQSGAAFIQYKPLIEVELGKTYEGIEQSIVEALKLAEAAQTDSFQVLNQWTPRMAELRQHACATFKGKCHVPKFNPKLGADGNVYSCCELAYADRGRVGSIYEESPVAIYEKLGQVYLDQAECPHCWDKPVNTLINEGKLGESPVPPPSVDQEFV